MRQWVPFTPKKRKDRQSKPRKKVPFLLKRQVAESEMGPPREGPAEDELWVKRENGVGDSVGQELSKVKAM